MEYNLELEKEKNAGYMNMDVHAELLDAGDCLMMDVQYIDGLKKLLNIKSQLSN